MCVGFLPSAFTPSWHDTQLFVMPACVKFAGFHAIVEWQALQSCLACVGTCVGFFPVAFTPSWHDEHEPVTWVWSTFVAGFHAVVAWQLSQLFVEAMCVG